MVPGVVASRICLNSGCASARFEVAHAAGARCRGYVCHCGSSNVPQHAALTPRRALMRGIHAPLPLRSPTWHSEASAWARHASSLLCCAMRTCTRRWKALRTTAGDSNPTSKPCANDCAAPSTSTLARTAQPPGCHARLSHRRTVSFSACMASSTCPSWACMAPRLSAALCSRLRAAASSRARLPAPAGCAPASPPSACV